MIHKLRYSLLGLASPRRRDCLPALKGNMRRMIVVRSPDPIFQEALFVLRDDYFSQSGLSQKELLKQARSAAEDYVQESLPPPEPPVLPGTLAIYFLGAASAIFALWIGGLI